MFTRRLVIAAFLFAALGGLCLLDAQRKEGARLAYVVETAILPGVGRRSEIMAIEIRNNTAEHRFNQHILLERDPAAANADRPDEGWRMTVPRDLPAWPDVMSILTQNLLGAKRRNEFEGAPDAGNGLLEPRLTATFRVTLPDEETITIEFGARSPYNSEIFARASDRPDRLFTVREGMFEALRAEASAYIDMRLLVRPPNPILAVSLKNGYGETLLSAREDGGWSVGGALTADGDKEVVAAWLGDIERLKMAHVLTSPTLELAGQEPFIVLATSDGLSTNTLTLGDRLPGREAGSQRFAARSDYPNVFVVDALVADHLDRPPAFFRNRRIFAFDPARAVAFRVIFGDDHVQVRRKSPADPWHLVGRSRRPLRQAFLNNALDNLSKLRSRGEFPLSEEAEAILFTPKDVLLEVDLAPDEAAAPGGEPLTRRLRLSKRTPDPSTMNIYARVDEESHAIALPMKTLTDHWLRLDAIVEKSFLHGRLQELRAITVEGPKVRALFTGVVNDQNRVEWSCRLEEPALKEGAVNDALMGELLRMADALAFERLMTLEEEVAANRTPETDIRITFESADGTIESVAAFARTNEAGLSPARLSDDTMVLVPRHALIDFLRAILEKVMPFLDPVDLH